MTKSSSLFHSTLRGVTRELSVCLFDVAESAQFIESLLACAFENLSVAFDAYQTDL